MIAAAGGFKATLVMPETASPSKINGARNYGAEVVLTPSVRLSSR